MELCRRRPAVLPLEVSLTAFLRAGEAKGKTCKSGGKKRGGGGAGNDVDFGVSIVSLHHTSEGTGDFYWACG